MCLLSVNQLSDPVNFDPNEVAFPQNKCPNSTVLMPSQDFGKLVCCQKLNGRRAQFLRKYLFIRVMFIHIILSNLTKLLFY
jgi:hypothetical protein